MFFAATGDCIFVTEDCRCDQRSIGERTVQLSGERILMAVSIYHCEG